jgi:hypothetical protein
MTASRVLIISGPIASGKSTVAHALAAESRAVGPTAAVVDLDRMYVLLDDSPLMSDPRISARARRAAAALVDQYALDGIDLIIVEGDFWIASQHDEFNQWSYEPSFPVIRRNGGHFVRIHRAALERWLEEFALGTSPRSPYGDAPPVVGCQPPRVRR